MKYRLEMGVPSRCNYLGITDEEHLLRGVLFQARERTLRPLSGHGSLVRPEGIVHPAVIRHVLALSVLAIDLLLN